MRIIEINAYKFEELSDEVKQKVIEKNQDINVDYEWWEFLFEDAGNIGLKIKFFNLDRASFVKGKFILDAKEVAENILREHGESCSTVQTAKDYLVTLKAETDKVLLEFANKEYPEDFLEDFLHTKDIDNEFLKSLCEDYRVMLQKEYDYLTSEEAIIETINANECEFTENGKLI